MSRSMTPNAGSDTSKKTRESTSKVRTGCKTCKERRVKCDEAKPSCRRCQAGHRHCAYGATNNSVSSRSRIIVYVPPIASQPASPTNSQHLQLLHTHIAVELDGHFTSHFWTRLVPQLFHAEAAVQNAVTAISLTYRDVEHSLQTTDGRVEANDKGRRAWYQSLRHLQERISTEPSSYLVPLVCCVLFACTELLRGGLEASLAHMQSGFRILEDSRRVNDAILHGDLATTANDTKLIDSYVRSIFARLNVLCSLAGKSTPSAIQELSQTDGGFRDLAEARLRLSKISDLCIRFIGEANEKAAAFLIDMEELARQHQLLNVLKSWRERLHILIQLSNPKEALLDLSLVDLLLVQYRVIFIWLHVCTQIEETATDPFHADFEDIVRRIESLVSTGSVSASPRILSFDVYILGPLYYTALKCRDATVRRRALRLLKYAPRREGLWNAHHAYAAAERVIQLEERHLDAQGLPEEAARIHGLTLPEETINLDDDDFRHEIVLSPCRSGMLETVFRTRPGGPLGEWVSSTERIKL